MSIIAKLIGDDYGIKGTGRWLRSREHSSLVIDEERNLFYFNAENVVGGPMTYLTKIRGWSFERAKEYLKTLPGFETTVVYTISDIRGDVVVYPELVDAFWEHGVKHRDYWYRRCLTDSTIDRFRLGYYNGFYSLPVYVGGVFRNFQMRQDIPSKRIRPWYRGVGPLVFNSDVLKIVNKVYITEGPVDAILLNQFGIPAISHTSGATGWQSNWIRYFTHVNEIIYIADNDKAGVSGAKIVSKNLGIYRVKVFTFSGFDDKYDTVNYFQDGGAKENFIKLVEDNAKFIFEGVK